MFCKCVANQQGNKDKYKENNMKYIQDPQLEMVMSTVYS